MHRDDKPTEPHSPLPGTGPSETATTAAGDWPLSPLWELVRARLLEFFREPEAIFWVYGFPLLMSLALGVAFRDQPREVFRVAVVEGPGAEMLAAALEGTSTEFPAAGASSAAEDHTAEGNPAEPASPPSARPRARLIAERLPEDEARRRLRVGKVALILAARERAANSVANPSTSNPSASGQSPSQSPELAGRLAELAVDFQYDPTRPESVSARGAVDDALQRAAGRLDPLAVGEQLVTEPGGRYIDFLIPGLIGASLMGGGLWGVGFVTVELRVRNLLKRLITTPMKKSHFLGGLMLSRFFFMVTEVGLLIVFARLVFGVVVAGNLLSLAAFIALGAWTFAGLGLLVASRARTLETASGLMNLVMMPMYVASGIFFSSERFPELVQPLIQALPLTALIDALRGVMLEGTPLTQLAGEAGILLAWSLVSFVLAFRWFRWT